MKGVFNLNNCSFIGRLVKDPEINTRDDKKVCNFRIAVDRVFSKNDEADFIPVTVWGKQAENLVKYCKKGSNICVVGELRTSTYEKEGIKYYTFEILSNQIQFLDFKKSNDDNSSAE